MASTSTTRVGHQVRPFDDNPSTSTKNRGARIVVEVLGFHTEIRAPRPDRAQPGGRRANLADFLGGGAATAGADRLPPAAAGIRTAVPLPPPLQRSLRVTLGAGAGWGARAGCWSSPGWCRQ